MQKSDKAAERNEHIEIYQKSQNEFKLKNIQNEIINKNNSSKTWCRNFAHPAGMH